MFWKSERTVVDTLSGKVHSLQTELREVFYQCGVADGKNAALESELKELRETNRRLLDHIAGMSGAPIFTPQVPATADGTKPVSFNQTPRDFVEEAEELERKALRDKQNELLEMFAARRAREMEDVPKESAA